MAEGDPVGGDGAPEPGEVVRGVLDLTGRRESRAAGLLLLLLSVLGLMLRLTSTLG